MNDFPKVLVVDDGERTPDDALSAELAGLGYASVTASLEAAEDVLMGCSRRFWDAVFRPRPRAATRPRGAA